MTRRGFDPCEYVLDGTDTDGTEWFECVTHEDLAPSDCAPCASWVRRPDAFDVARLFAQIP